MVCAKPQARPCSLSGVAVSSKLVSGVSGRRSSKRPSVSVTAVVEGSPAPCERARTVTPAIFTCMDVRRVTSPETARYVPGMTRSRRGSEAPLRTRNSRISTPGRRDASVGNTRTS